MKLTIFSVFDTKASVFGTPFFMPSVGTAVRAFGDLVQDPKSTVNRHPSDFILYEIGEFDDNSSQCVSLPTPRHLAHASDFVQFKSSEGFASSAKVLPVLTPDNAEQFEFEQAKLAARDKALREAARAGVQNCQFGVEAVS